MCVCVVNVAGGWVVGVCVYVWCKHVWDSTAFDFYTLVANRSQMYLPPGSSPSKEPFISLSHSL